MKWSQMEKTLNDDDVPEDNSEDDEEDIVDMDYLLKREEDPHS